MSVVKINALAIPPQAGDEVVKRFTARLGELSKVDGFEGFELLKPTADNEPRWFVYSRWRDEAAFQAWRTSDTFNQSHAGQGGPGGAPAAGGHPGAAAGHPGAAGGHPGAAGGHPGAGGPVATGSELLEFEVTVSAEPA